MIPAAQAHALAATCKLREPRIAKILDELSLRIEAAAREGRWDCYTYGIIDPLNVYDDTPDKADWPSVETELKKAGYTLARINIENTPLWFIQWGPPKKETPPSTTSKPKTPTEASIEQDA